MKWIALALAVYALAMYAGMSYLLLEAPSTTPAGAGIGACAGNAVVATVGAAVTFHVQRKQPRRP